MKAITARQRWLSNLAGMLPKVNIVAKYATTSRLSFGEKKSTKIQEEKRREEKEEESVYLCVFN